MAGVLSLLELLWIEPGAVLLGRVSIGVAIHGCEIHGSMNWIFSPLRLRAWPSPQQPAEKVQIGSRPE